jgi:transposase
VPTLSEQLERSYAEINELSARLALLEQERQSELRARDERIEALIEQLRLLKAQVYGRSSEKRSAEEFSPDQARLLFNEVEAIAHTPAASASAESLSIPAHSRKKSGRKALPSDLPRIELIHDLPQEQKHCSHDGAALTVIDKEESEQLDYVPAKLRVIRHIRLKYGCPCCKQGVKLAPTPTQLFPKSNATPALLAHITTAKYVDGTPLHRQEAQFARMGVDLPRATMARWMIQLGGEHLVPLINLMQEQMLSASLIHMDETSVQVLKSDKAPTADHWMWVRASGPPGKRLVLYDYDPSRGGTIPKRLLEDFAGVLLTDGYEAYAAAVTAHSLTHAGCWAHVRRKFEEARKVQSQSDSRARIALDDIGRLYGIERHLREHAESLSDEHRLQIRHAQSAPIVAELHRWLTAMSSEVLPQSALGKAIAYALTQWPKLIVFLDRADVPLDNNRCENAIRPFVIGRKNWLFSDTQAGAQASANLYSLIETAKANGIEPHAYLTWLYAQLPHATRLEHVEALLPWNVKAELTASR